ncbi:G1/S-specific cyclin-D2-like [Trichogramma pretiosum]|uniref:G1/S-specific cyclin-D2-like n=1 Tax=Trichogramma pretiosum TaxID=7493 RepID=UPI0006C96CD1|nr:G1/S-specific cyclin-D2-like [Trichogramma pretiosum]
MDLLCCESTSQMECPAYPDPNLLDDDRMLQNLLKSEERYAPSATYFSNVQKEITPVMRKVVAEWMLEVCEEQKREEVFPLAMNYVDRFLSICPIRKQHLQLLGTACLLLASKLREPRPISAEVLVFYTDNSITLQELWRWEQLVVSKLKWDLSAVTPNDFILYILARLPVDSRRWDTRMIRRHARTFIDLSHREYCFSMYTPSIVAAAAIATALDGLDWTNKTGYSLNWLLAELTRITAVEQEYLKSCHELIEEMARGGNVSNLMHPGTHSLQHQQQQQQQYHHNQTIDRVSDVTMTVGDESTGTTMMEQDKITDYENKTGTPTDVRDIHF